MPDISFPSNPAVNDTYSFGGKTWIWTGSYWALNTAGSINGIPIGNITPSTGVFTTLSATGNVTASYFIGDGSQLTGLPASYGNANVVANLAALSSNPISTTGNVTASYFIGDGSQLTGLPASYGNANVVTLLSSFGSNTISTTGNVTGGNGIFAGNVTVNDGSAVATLGRTVAFIIAYGA